MKCQSDVQCYTMYAVHVADKHTNIGISTSMSIFSLHHLDHPMFSRPIIPSRYRCLQYVFGTSCQTSGFPQSLIWLIWQAK